MAGARDGRSGRARLLAIAALVSGALSPLAAPASAEVLDSGDAGFVTHGSALVAAPPAAIWAALVEPARWWSPAHSWSGDAANLTLSATAGGCLCERLPDGGSVEHLRVIHAAPGRLLRAVGALGPLQGEALAATLTIALAPEGEGTRLAWRYGVAGKAGFPLAEVAPAADAVVSEQMARLAALFAPAAR